jgi:hypothetical protein
LTALFASSVYAEQKPPGGDEGQQLPASAVSALKLTGACRVALPDANGNQPRVARTAARMSAWVADQKPMNGQTPRVYLHREGDRNVFLRGPAINGVNMGAISDVAIHQRESEDKKAEAEPIGIIDHTDEVHWVALDNIGKVRDSLQEFKNGLFDGGFIGKMSFEVRNARPTKHIGEHTHENADSYTVTALVIKLGGQPRVFGICM